MALSLRQPYNYQGLCRAPHELACDTTCDGNELYACGGVDGSSKNEYMNVYMVNSYYEPGVRFCGDGIQSPWETCASCPADAGFCDAVPAGCRNERATFSHLAFQSKTVDPAKCLATCADMGCAGFAIFAARQCWCETAEGMAESGLFRPDSTTTITVGMDIARARVNVGTDERLANLEAILNLMEEDSGEEGEGRRLAKGVCDMTCGKDGSFPCGGEASYSLYSITVENPAPKPLDRATTGGANCENV